MSQQYLDEVNAIDLELKRNYRSKESIRYDEIMEQYVPAVRAKYPDAKRVEPIIKWWNHGMNLDLMPIGVDEGIAVELEDKWILVSLENNIINELKK